MTLTLGNIAKPRPCTIAKVLRPKTNVGLCWIMHEGGALYLFSKGPKPHIDNPQ